MANRISKRYGIPFGDLFDSKEQAVTAYLSLERRYMQLSKAKRYLTKTLFGRTTIEVNWRCNDGTRHTGCGSSRG